VVLSTLDWVHWFNNKRLLEPIGYIPPAEAEAAYYRQLPATLEATLSRARVPRARAAKTVVAPRRATAKAKLA